MTPTINNSKEVEMSDKEILEKAIQKAIDGGYELVKAKDWLWRAGEGSATGLCIHILPDEDKLGLITYISYPIAYERVIFNHDFAKALWRWGGKAKMYYSFPLHWGMYQADDIDPTSAELEEWQYHLQQMVISNDPIKYLGENI